MGSATEADAGSIGAPRSATGTGFDLLLLCALVVGLNLPQLRPAIVPINDTFYTFANFHVFYSELVTHGGLARWLPYEGFGVQSDYEQLIALGPASYAVALVGWVAGTQDVLRLFQWSVVLEQMAFVFGVFVFARHRFATRATALVLGVGAAGTTVWYAQQWWDLRIYYLLPLVLHFLLRFFEERRASLLWLAGLIGVAWSIGNLPYLVPLWLLTLAAIATVAVREPLPLLRSLAVRSREDALGLVAFGVAAAVLIAFLAGALDNVVLDAPSRNRVTGAVEAETFRSFGGQGNLVIVLNALLFGWPVHLPWGSWADNSAYLGLLPLLGLGIACVRERSRVFLALLGAALLLAWLSFGGAFTRVAYYLPGLAYFRHVGLVFGVVKVLLLLAAGFGLERLWKQPSLRLRNPVLIAMAVVLAIEVLWALPSLPGTTPHDWIVVWGTHFFVRLFLYCATAAVLWGRPAATVGLGLAGALALDVALYQVAVLDRIPQLTRDERGMRVAARVREPLFEPQRRDLPAELPAAVAAIGDPARRDAFALAVRSANREAYVYAYQFANVDPCESRLRTDAHQQGVDRLLALGRAGLPTRTVIGCESPKLRVVGDARSAGSEAEARRMLAAALRHGEASVLVLRDPAGGNTVPASASAEAGSARVERFTLADLVVEADVTAPEGAWLVYSDAWHPDWRATVNGESTPVVEANLAFKAVRLPAGRSEVRFWFDRGVRGPLLALLGLGFAVAAALGLLRTIFGGRAGVD